MIDYQVNRTGSDASWTVRRNPNGTFTFQVGHAKLDWANYEDFTVFMAGVLQVAGEQERQAGRR